MLGPYPCTICSVPEFHLKCNCNGLWHPMANIFSCQALWHQVTCIHTAPSQAGSLADICAFCCLAPDEPISWSPHCHKACLLSQSHQQVTPSDSVFPSHIRAPQCHLALNVWAPWRVLEASPRSCHPKLLALSKPACLMHMYDGTETAFQSVASSPNPLLKQSSLLSLCLPASGEGQEPMGTQRLQILVFRNSLAPACV